MHPKSLLIRADETPEIGTGHVMRCLALSQAWRDSGGDVVFLTKNPSLALQKRLSSEQIKIEEMVSKIASETDARHVVDLAHEIKASWIVVDGYQFDSVYQRFISRSGRRLLLIDDQAHLGEYHADIILNQNLYASSKMYERCGSDTKLLLGSRYALLRREFRLLKRRNRHSQNEGANVLVTLGGSDPHNVTLQVLKALRLLDVPKLRAAVVVGRANPHFDQLKTEADRAVFPVAVHRDVCNIAAFMEWADIAVSGAGTTTFESLFMGLSAIVMILADNQRQTAAALEAGEAAVNLGPFEKVDARDLEMSLKSLMTDARKRKLFSDRGHMLVDGLGVERVLMHLESRNFYLRRVDKKDKKILFELANDPEVRKASFSTDALSWEMHCEWFDSKLVDPQCFFYLAADEQDVPIGQIRFDLSGGEAIISASLFKQFRHRGYGVPIITAATARFLRESNTKKVAALVKAENASSINAFCKCGFRKEPCSQTIHGMGSIRLSFDKPDAREDPKRTFPKTSFV